MASDDSDLDEPKSKQSEASKRGNAYEVHAIARYAEAHKDRIVFPGERVPPLLLANIHGEPLTVEGLQKCVKLSAKWGDEMLKTGKRSELIGMDGVAVAKVPFLNHKTDELQLEILEAKSREKGVDAHILGTSIGVMLRAVGVYGARDPRMPVLKVLSPHRPTGNVDWVFALMPRLYSHVPTPLPTWTAPAEAAPTEAASFDKRVWQRSAERATVSELRPKTFDDKQLAKWAAVCGAGKTLAALMVLMETKWANVKVFLVHRACMAGQVIKEAKGLGLEEDKNVFNLTCTRTRERFWSPTTSTNEEDEDEEDESDDEGEEEEGEDEGEGEEEEGEEEAVAAPPTELASKQIIEGFKEKVAAATKDKPVYLILCHQTMKIMTCMGSAEAKKKKIKKPKLYKSQWSDILEGLCDGQRLMVVVDEWHKLHHARDLFTSLFAQPKRCKALLMTGTEHPTKTYRSTLGKENADIIKNARKTGGVTMSEGIQFGYIVGAHVETVYATDAATGEAVDCKDTPLGARAKQVAAWMVANSIRTAVCYCKSITQTDAFVPLLEAALVEASGGLRAWCRPVHSGKACKGKNRTLDEFKKPKTRAEDPDYRVVVSVDMLKEGYDFAGLEACVLLAIPPSSGGLMQVIQRCMRADGKKAVGRVLLVGTDRDGGNVAGLLHQHDPKWEHISLGATPGTLQGYADLAANNAEARTQHERKAKEYTECVKHAVEFLTADHDVKMKAIWDAYLAAFPNSKPTIKDMTKITFTLCGKTVSIVAAHWINQVRFHWHRSEGSHVTSPALKAKMSAHPESIGGVPPLPVAKSDASTSARALIAYLNTNGRKPRILAAFSRDDATPEQKEEYRLGYILYKVNTQRFRQKIGPVLLAELEAAIAATANSDAAKDAVVAQWQVIIDTCVTKRNGSAPWPTSGSSTRTKSPGYDDLEKLKTGQYCPAYEEWPALVRVMIAESALRAPALAEEPDTHALARSHLLAHIDHLQAFKSWKRALEKSEAARRENGETEDLPLAEGAKHRANWFRNKAKSMFSERWSSLNGGQRAHAILAERRKALGIPSVRERKKQRTEASSSSDPLPECDDSDTERSDPE